MIRQSTQDQNVDWEHDRKRFNILRDIFLLAEEHYPVGARWRQRPDRQSSS